MQQREWFIDSLIDALAAEGPPCHFARLPRELIEAIVDELPHFMTRHQAFEIREKLMDERTQFIEVHNSGYFGAPRSAPRLVRSPDASCRGIL